MANEKANTLVSEESEEKNKKAKGATGDTNVEGEYSASIPCGYIVVANGDGPIPAGPVSFLGPAAGMTDQAYGGGPNDIFSDLLMNQPVFITPNGQAMDTNLNDILNIKQFKTDNPGQPIPANLVNALDGPSPKQAAADSIPADSVPISSCDNYNSTPTAPQADPNCFNNLQAMATTYGFTLPNGSNGPSLNGLMAIEKYKAQVINPRPGGGPAIVTGMENVCTGMKQFPLGGISANEPIAFGKPPTVGNLVGSFLSFGNSAPLASIINNQLRLKIRQIRPETSDSEISALLNGASLPMGQVRYIWMDDSRVLRFTAKGSLPSWISGDAVIPDGTGTTATTGNITGNRNFVNIEGEQGYPSPWDCFGSGPDQTKSDMLWQRSSGFNCLQGVLRFRNCVNANTDPWDCPC